MFYLVIFWMLWYQSVVHEHLKDAGAPENGTEQTAGGYPTPCERGDEM